MAVFVIALHNLRFFAAHGVYEEEKLLGNEFEVNVKLTVKAPEESVSKLEQTIDYAEVYRIAKEVFSQPEPLLETLAQEMAAAIKKAFPPLKKISLQITKLHPPITAFTGLVSVTYQTRFKER